MVFVEVVAIIVKSEKFLAVSPVIGGLAMSIGLLLIDVVIPIWSTGLSVGGVNSPLIENFNVDNAGIYILEILEIITCWFANIPVHCSPALTVGDRLVQDIVVVIGSLRVALETSSVHALLVGNLIIIVEPTGSEFVVTIVNIISLVVLTVVGLKLIIDWFSVAGERLTAENGLLAE
jgi:hypothetical protein